MMKYLLAFFSFELSSRCPPFEGNDRKTKRILAILGYSFDECFTLHSCFVFSISDSIRIKEACSFAHIDSLKLFLKVFAFLIGAGLNSSIEGLEPIWAYPLISRTFINLVDDGKTIKWNSCVIFDKVTKHPLFDNSMHYLLYLLLLVDYLTFLDFFRRNSVMGEIIADWDVVDLLSVYFRVAVITFQEMH